MRLYQVLPASPATDGFNIKHIKLRMVWLCKGIQKLLPSFMILQESKMDISGIILMTLRFLFTINCCADTLICCGWSRSLRTLLAREQIWQGQRACQDRGCGWSRAWWLQQRHGSFAWWTRPQPGAVPSPVRSVSSTMYPSISQKDIPVILYRVSWLIFFSLLSQVAQPSSSTKWDL